MADVNDGCQLTCDHDDRREEEEGKRLLRVAYLVFLFGCLDG